MQRRSEESSSSGIQEVAAKVPMTRLRSIGRFVRIAAAEIPMNRVKKSGERKGSTARKPAIKSVEGTAVRIIAAEGAGGGA